MPENILEQRKGGRNPRLELKATEEEKEVNKNRFT
jgi:hypothetical protein